MVERHTAQGWWLEQAGPVEPAPRLAGAVEADVVVVGGGYTGMWAAWQAKQLEPEANVAVVEAAICGEGPSGRNGGFVNQMWFSLPTLRRRFGDEPALAVARAAQDAVGGVGRFCAEQDVDAWFRHGGYLQVSTTPLHDGTWLEALAACRELGEPDACVPLGPDQVRERCASPAFRSGAFYPGAATVNPALLARGLRRRLLDRGVAIFERSPVRRVDASGGGVVVEAEGGRVTAGAAVLASGGRLGRLPGLRRRLTMTSSHMVITEPVPDVLDELGWTGGECITDSRAMLHYFRTTPDGRIAFGWGGGKVGFGTRTGGRAEIDRALSAEVERHLLRFFPRLAGRRIEHAWGGPIDVSPTHLPVVGTVPGEPVHYAFGYTGNGVGPSYMAGRILASLALDRRDQPTRLAIVDPPPVRVPPEPLRFVGGAIVRRALLRKEAAEEQGRRPDRFSALVAGIPERIGIHVGR
ncbi:MAG TPA: FAD-dependent oxidoreductase [Solirubrobacterales bacterium]|nr:FAD-dependent oxidoreductase [Solirubrobacterales bacterium]